MTAKSKLGYMKWGWIDLLSSIPAVSFLRWGRFVRLIRILRIIRGIKSARMIMTFLFANRAKGALTAVALICFVLVIFSSITVLELEASSPNANIKTAGDAMWWAYATITTVGYGDKYPVTAGGRILAAILMTAGIGLFGTFTAYVASTFLNPPKKPDGEPVEQKILKQLGEITSRLEAIEKATSVKDRE